MTQRDPRSFYVFVAFVIIVVILALSHFKEIACMPHPSYGVAQSYDREPCK